MPEKLIPILIAGGGVLVSIGGFVGVTRLAQNWLIRRLEIEREERMAADEALREHFSFEVARVCTMCREFREDCKGNFKDDFTGLKVEMNERFKKLDEKIGSVGTTVADTREILLLMASPEIRQAIIHQQMGGK